MEFLRFIGSFITSVIFVFGCSAGIMIASAFLVMAPSIFIALTGFTISMIVTGIFGYAMWKLHEWIDF